MQTWSKRENLCVVTYLLDELKVAIFLEFWVKQTTVADDDLAYTILFKKEWIGLLVLFGVFVAQVLEQNGLFAGLLWVQVVQGVVIGAT